MAKKGLLLASVLLAFATGPLQGGEPKNADGDWWIRASSAQRTGWLNGFADCWAYDKDRADDVKGAPFSILTEKINNFYRSNPTQLRRSLPKTFVEQAKRINVPEAPGGEHYTQPHGYYTGDYFRQLLEPVAREAFIGGYLACYATMEHPKASFTKPTSWYTNEVSTWLGLQESDESVIDDKRADVPIADALRKFKDQ